MDSSYCSLTMSGKSFSFLSFNVSSTENIMDYRL